MCFGFALFSFFFLLFARFFVSFFLFFNSLVDCFLYLELLFLLDGGFNALKEGDDEGIPVSNKRGDGIKDDDVWIKDDPLELISEGVIDGFDDIELLWCNLR